MVSPESLLNPLTSQENLQTQSCHHSTFYDTTALTTITLQCAHAAADHCSYCSASPDDVVTRGQRSSRLVITRQELEYRQEALLYCGSVKRVVTPTVLSCMMLSNVTDQ